MKTILATALVALSFSSLASTTLLDCRVTRMENYYFEEGLSVGEYPDVEISRDAAGKLEAIFGVSSYTAADGDKVTLRTNAQGELVAEVTIPFGDVITMKVERRRTMAKFTLRVKEVNEPKAYTIGYGICSKGIL